MRRGLKPRHGGSGRAAVLALDVICDFAFPDGPRVRRALTIGTALEFLLDDHRIDTLIIVGVSAESCVCMTACDAHARGYSLVVPRDSLAGVSAKGMRATMTGLAKP